MNKTQAQRAQRLSWKKKKSKHLYLQSLWLEYCALSPRLPCSQHWCLMLNVYKWGNRFSLSALTHLCLDQANSLLPSLSPTFLPCFRASVIHYSRKQKILSRIFHYSMTYSYMIDESCTLTWKTLGDIVAPTMLLGKNSTPLLIFVD